VVSDVQLPGAPPQEGRVRRANRAQERRRKRRRHRSRVAVLVGLALLIAAGGLVWWGIKPIIAGLTEPDDYPGPGTGSVLITVPDGASGRAIGRILADHGVVKTAKAFTNAASLDKRAAGIRPGTYELRLKMSSTGAIGLLADPKNRITKTFTVAEGKRVSEIVDIIAKAGIPKADLVAALADPQSIGLPAYAKGTAAGVKVPAEGFLFPATYEVQPGDTAVSVLTQMVDQTRKELTAAGVPAGKEWAVLTEASILQAEGGKGSDFPKVARVLENRLKIGMMLQLDSTTAYAVQRFGVTTTAKERASTSKYNTYHWKGLPVGPISNPGAAAIEAALKPSTGTWLYFVTVNPETGETKFATTEAEKLALNREFQAWLAKHPQSSN
jgi:UPF0755 protein